MSKSNKQSKNKGENKMAVFTKPNKYTYAIKAEHRDAFVKSANTKQENEWVKEKAELFKKNNLRTNSKED